MKKIMLKKLYKLPDGRSVSVDTSSGILNISHFSKIKKNRYNAFVESYISPASTHSRIRDLFHDLQSKSFSIHPGLLSILLSRLFTYVPPVTREGGNFLDIGCNTGIFLSKISDKWKKYGVEINDTAYKTARTIKSIKVSHTEIENYIPKIKFNYIRASHVIEHLEDPVIFFKKIKKIANPKAHVLIYTPNSDSISLFLFKKYWYCFSERTHVKIFNINNLSKIAQDNGFRVVESGTYSIGITAGSIMDRLDFIKGTVLFMPTFFLIFVLLYPLSLLANAIKKGGALYLYLQNK